MDPRPPIDLPDDFGLNDPDYGHTISWMAIAFIAVLFVAALAVLLAVTA